MRRQHKVLILSAAVFLLVGFGAYLLMQRRPSTDEAQGNRQEGARADAVPTGNTPAGTSASNQKEPHRTTAPIAPPTSPQEQIPARGQDVAFTDLPALASSELDNLSMQGEVTLGIRNAERQQDAAMQAWPEYAKVREQLMQEISQEYPSLSHLPAKDIVGKAVELREQFWTEGGNLSATSWRSGYKAILMAEMAAEKAPTDLGVVDELVETLQSVSLVYKYDPQRGHDVRNTAVWQQIEELRQKQFDQIKQETSAGRQPDLRDYARCADLLYMVQALPPHTQRSLDVLKYMQGMCRQSGWTKFESDLNFVRKVIEKQGAGYSIQVYVAQHNEFPEEYGYGRRLPSFRGPADRSIITVEEMKK